jgi:hypothetical protein
MTDFNKDEKCLVKNATDRAELDEMLEKSKDYVGEARFEYLFN